LGVDVTQVFGISETLALDIISEVGIDMHKWPSKKHFASWLNLAPNNRISGGKLLRGKKQKKKNRASQAFLMAAYALQRSNHWLGAFYRRIKARKGALVATKATARKIATIFYHIVKDQVAFNPIPVKKYEQDLAERKMKYIQRQASKMGMALVPI
jgi:transposase